MEQQRKVIQQRAMWGFGLAAGGLNVLAGSGMVFSMLMVFTPLFTLFWCGLRYGAPVAAGAMLVAALVTLAGSGAAAGMVFLIFMGAPVVLLLRRLLRHNGQAYYPAGLAMVDATVLLVALLLVILPYSTLNPQAIASQFLPVGKGADSAVMQDARRMLSQHLDLIIAAMVWLWLSCLYGLAVLANFLLERRTLRLSLAITPFMPAGWLLVALLAAGTGAFFDSQTLQFCAKTLFLILLYPYFLMGLAALHDFSRRWPLRGAMLGMLYVMFLLAAPLLALPIGWGIIMQGRYLSNRAWGPGQAPR